MQTTATHAATAAKHFQISICAGRNTTQVTCMATSLAKAWDTAWSVAERLLGDVPPARMSVSPVTVH